MAALLGVALAIVGMGLMVYAFIKLVGNEDDPHGFA
jgi:hypothetical protein